MLYPGAGQGQALTGEIEIIVPVVKGTEEQADTCTAPCYVLAYFHLPRHAVPGLSLILFRTSIPPPFHAACVISPELQLIPAECRLRF